MMKKSISCGWALGLSAILVASHGCSQQEAADALQSAEDTAKGAADTVAKGAEEAVQKGGEIASELGEQAMAFLTPIKEQLGGLEGLKDKPEELKAAVTKLIQSIEDKTADIKLPEAVTTTLATLKEKLVALRDYLAGEVEQAKVDEQIQGIMESVESGLGISMQ
jgi:archaellum component FlaC